MAVNPLLRFGFARPHLFVATAPGGAAARLAVERFARTHGWPVAAAPADADLLVVCGTPTGWLAEAVEVVWGQAPAPRARLEVTAAEQAPDSLIEAQRRLLDPVTVEPEHAIHHQVGEHAGHHMHEMQDEEHSGHEGHHGHGGTVAGLAMAGRGADRDGLNLDEVHVALGPFLPAWPAGLRVRLTLQGDVVGEAVADHIPSADAEVFSSSPQRLAAGRLDAFAALAEVTGDDRSALYAADEPGGSRPGRTIRRLAYPLSPATQGNRWNGGRRRTRRYRPLARLD
jgi:hypothetical protein